MYIKVTDSLSIEAYKTICFNVDKKFQQNHCSPFSLTMTVLLKASSSGPLCIVTLNFRSISEGSGVCMEWGVNGMRNEDVFYNSTYSTTP